MSAKEWFGGIVNDWEDPDERIDERRFWLATVKLFGILACVLAIISTLQGCATVEKPFCAMQLIGQTSNGIAVVEVHCITKQEFEDAQK